MLIIFAVPLKIDAIYTEVIDSEAGRSLTQDRVRASLSLLCGAPLVRGAYEDEDEDGDVSYSIGMMPFFSFNFVK